MNIVYKEKVGLVETSIAMEQVEFRDFSSHANREDSKLKRTELLDKSCGAGELIPEGEL